MQLHRPLIIAIVTLGLVSSTPTIAGQRHAKPTREEALAALKAAAKKLATAEAGYIYSEYSGGSIRNTYFSMRKAHVAQRLRDDLAAVAAKRLPRISSRATKMVKIALAHVDKAPPAPAQVAGIYQPSHATLLKEWRATRARFAAYRRAWRRYLDVVRPRAKPVILYRTLLQQLYYRSFTASSSEQPRIFRRLAERARKAIRASAAEASALDKALRALSKEEGD